MGHSAADIMEKFMFIDFNIDDCYFTFLISFGSLLLFAPLSIIISLFFDNISILSFLAHSFVLSCLVFLKIKKY